MHSSKKYKKLVVFTSRFPYPLEKGDKLRAYHQIKELSSYFEIHLFSISEQKVQRAHLDELKKYCSEVHTFYLSPIKKWSGAFFNVFGKKPIQVGYFYNWSIHKKVKRLIEKIKPDHIYAQLIRSSEYVKHYHDCPKTIDYMDALSKGLERRSETATGLKKWIFQMEFKRLMDYENSIFEYFENHTIISEQDRKYIFHKHRDQIEIVPNGVNTDYFKISTKEKRADLVFTGNMSYPPNITASKYIVQEVLPLLNKNIKIILAGANPSKEVLALQSDQVEVTGWVDDIRTCYTAAKVFVAPMFIGTGLQNKLLEAMAIGVPCVTTTLANNALGAEVNEEVLLANDAESFRDKIMELLNNETKSQYISKNAKRFVQDNYDWKPVTRKLIELIDF
ncbi:MAG: glycosyltransferase [Fluviicola sp.]|nr:MAG: glycosyltransferase [Fluviicola sp.]